RMAEADENRTRQTEMLGLTGFEDRGAHQDTYASAAQAITAGPAPPLPRAGAPRGLGSGHERALDPSPGPALHPSDHHGARRRLRLEDPRRGARGGGLGALRAAVRAGGRGARGR